MRFALRQLLKHPGFTGLAALTLALGLGVNLALFAYFNEQFLRPLRVSKPEELWAILPADASGQPRFFNTSRYYYEAVREHKGAFRQIVGYARDGATFRSQERWEELRLLLVSGDYFEFLGVPPLLGRALLPDDEKPGAAPVVVISHRFWRRQFQEDPGVLGQALDLSGRKVEVVGVMPEGFTGMQSFNRPPELWAPARKDGAFNWTPGYELVGRLDPRISPAQAAASLASVVEEVTERLTREQVADASGNIAGFTQVAVKPAGRGEIPAEWVNADTYTPFRLAALGTALVLFIATSNLASFALARVLQRRKEIATRMAVGATRWAVGRQLALEGLLLAGLGGVGAAVSLGWVSRLLPVLMPATFPGSIALHVDIRVFAMACGLALLVGLVFSAVPALRAAAFDPMEALKGGSHGGAMERRWPWGRILVVVQIASSFALLSGALLCFQSFYRQVNLEVGFPADRLLLATVNLWELGFRDADAGREAEDIRGQLARLPGVEAAGLLAQTPFSGFGDTKLSSPDPNWIPGYTPPNGGAVETGFEHIGRDAFQALHVPVLQGREMTETDFAQHRLTALVNESFVRKFWPEQTPLGKEITLRRVNIYQVIGVVPDVRLEARAGPTQPTIYFSATDQLGHQPTFVLRVARNPAAIIPSVRAVLRNAHPRLGESDIMTVREAMGHSLYRERKAFSFLGWLGGSGLVLTALGIFGTVAYTVSQRTREFGIRLALGASRQDLFRQVLRSGAATAAVGTCGGIPLAIWGAMLLRHSSYSVETALLPAMAITAAVTTLATLAACCLPARWAAKTNSISELASQ